MQPSETADVDESCPWSLTSAGPQAWAEHDELGCLRCEAFRLQRQRSDALIQRYHAFVLVRGPW